MSGCIFRYGNYTHQPGEVGLTVAKQGVYHNGVLKYTRALFHLEGVLMSDNQADLIVANQGLQAAYGVNGNSAFLYAPDGQTIIHQMPAQTAIGFDEPRVGEIRYPEWKNAQLVTHYNYTITISATYPAQDDLLDYRESITTIGSGGPKFVMLQTLTGPIPFTTASSTPSVLIQSGHATGLYSFPTAPGPVAPGSVHQEKSKLTTEGPSLDENGVLTNYTVSWSYEMESVGLLGALPSFDS
jgi:hypothetical protein